MAFVDWLVGLPIGPQSRFLELLSLPVHPWLPVPWMALLHAARISVIYRSLRASAGASASRPADLAGFLLMSWGGSIASSIALGLPVPQLLSFAPFVVYSSTHLALGCLDCFPSLKTLDTLLPFLDALIRTNAIAAGVESCQDHHLVTVADSFSVQLFIGALSSSGGGILAQMMRVWEPNWRFCRPHFLEEGSILAGTDVWSGALVALIYGYLTDSHPIYSDLRGDDIEVPPTDAKVFAASILTLIYFWRAYRTHHAPHTRTVAERVDKSFQKDNKSKKE